MFFAERFKRDVYIAHINYGTRPPTYTLGKTPYKLNCLPTTADADMQVYGVGYTQRLRATCDKIYAADIREMDLAYIYVKPTEDSDELASDADFIVESKVDGLDSTSIVFVRRGGTDG